MLILQTITNEVKDKKHSCETVTQEEYKNQV